MNERNGREFAAVMQIDWCHQINVNALLIQFTKAFYIPIASVCKAVCIDIRTRELRLVYIAHAHPTDNYMVVFIKVVSETVLFFKFCGFEYKCHLYMLKASLGFGFCFCFGYGWFVMQDQTHFIISFCFVCVCVFFSSCIALQMQQIVQEPPVNCNALPIKQTISPSQSKSSVNIVK